MHVSTNAQNIPTIVRLQRQLDRCRKALKVADARVRELEATLDGDPHQMATPEQRRAWRMSAVRYADKLESELAECREACEGYKAAVMVCQSEKRDLTLELHECRESVEELKSTREWHEAETIPTLGDELAELRERLDHLQARHRVALRCLSKIPDTSGPHADRVWYAKGTRVTIAQVNDLIAEACETLEYGLGDDARESELEQRTVEVLDALEAHIDRGLSGMEKPDLYEWGEDTGEACSNVLDAHDAALERVRAYGVELGEEVMSTKQRCGHPVACIVSADEGTSHCAWCESLEQARAEERERFAVLLRQAAQLASIAADWHLPEVEINGEWVSTRELAMMFRKATQETDDSAAE